MGKKNLNQIKEKGEKLWEEVDRVMDIIEKTSPINESSLSRIWRYTEEYDIAIISASRTREENCLASKHGKEEGHEYTSEENNERTQSMKALLIKRGYGITAVDGSYIENFDSPSAVEVKEDSYVVINWNRDADFFNKIIRLGKYFCQDSVLLKEKGKEAYIYGTNNHDSPGLDKTIQLGKFVGGAETQFSTKVNGRPFTFMEGTNVMTKGVITRQANILLEKMGEDL